MTQPPVEGLGPSQTGRTQAELIEAAKRRLVRGLKRLAHRQPSTEPQCAEHIDAIEQACAYLQSEGAPEGHVGSAGQPVSVEELLAFGTLLRDKRNAAGLSRPQLGRKAKISDATIKFIETARHLPSRATLIRLVAVTDLKLTWPETPGHQKPPAPERTSVDTKTESELNCFISPTYDPIRTVMELGVFLNGAGGHVEQTHAYLDHQSAASYMALLKGSAVSASFRAASPLAQCAATILRACDEGDLRVIALGAGDGTTEVRLVQHLVESCPERAVELCLLDISQPLLSAAYKHAVEIFHDNKFVQVWGMQCNFHHLPLYTHLFAKQEPNRLFCMLGGTLANLDNEPRFFQHSLIECRAGDLLLVDMQIARGSTAEQIKQNDAAWVGGVPASHTSWLSGPIWRHCKDVKSVDFHFNLDLRCAVPGSYALDAIATVRAKGREDRQFSLFRFRRYDPEKLAQCLGELGWARVSMLQYGGEQPSCLMLLQKQ